MFDYLIQIEPRLYDRYLTVERNIKSASNSFYDSYLDMQEQFVKTVVSLVGIECNLNSRKISTYERKQEKNEEKSRKNAKSLSFFAKV